MGEVEEELLRESMAGLDINLERLKELLYRRG